MTDGRTARAALRQHEGCCGERHGGSNWVTDALSASPHAAQADAETMRAVEHALWKIAAPLATPEHVYAIADEIAAAFSRPRASREAPRERE